MTESAGDPITPITDATLTDIATNGIWGPGPSINPSVVAVSNAFVATLQGTAQGVLTPELQQLVDNTLQAATVGFPRIPVAPDVRLSAFTIKLNDGAPHPVVIMPAGWSPFGWLPFLCAYLTLAARGYHVLAYTPRGIGSPLLPSTSQGKIDVAGPQDWSDGSKMIDYAEAHLTPSRIGFLGESYGSGISQLVAAHDPGERVAAVVALSTWGNLATSLYANGTRHIQAVLALINFTGGPLETKFDERTQQILKDFLAGQNMNAVVAWGEERAPEKYVDRTNKRGIPTFISNTWHETLFPAGQVIETFTHLTVPKRLNMWIGDHGAPEAPGLAGLAIGGQPFPGLRVPMAEAYDWLDHHLLGADNGVPDWPQVDNQIMFTYDTISIPGGSRLITEPARREPRPTWQDVTTGTERWYLADGARDGSLGADQDTGWTRDFIAGYLTEATAVDKILETGQQEWFGNPKIYDLDKFERENLLVWQTAPLTGEGDVARRLRGVPTVRVTMRSTADTTTLVAYLFDVDEQDTARIIAHEPYTPADLVPNLASTVEWALQPVCYDLPANHRLALVINSRDELYSYASIPDSTITIGSPDDDPSYVDIPLG